MRDAPEASARNDVRPSVRGLAKPRLRGQRVLAARYSARFSGDDRRDIRRASRRGAPRGGAIVQRPVLTPSTITAPRPACAARNASQSRVAPSPARARAAGGNSILPASAACAIEQVRESAGLRRPRAPRRSRAARGSLRRHRAVRHAHSRGRSPAHPLHAPEPFTLHIACARAMPVPEEASRLPRQRSRIACNDWSRPKATTTSALLKRIAGQRMIVVLPAFGRRTLRQTRVILLGQRFAEGCDQIVAPVFHRHRRFCA